MRVHVYSCPKMQKLQLEVCGFYGSLYVHVCALRGGWTALSHAAGIEQRVGECAYPCNKWGGGKKEKCCESCWGTQKKGERRSVLSLIRVSASLSSFSETKHKPSFFFLFCLFCSHQIFLSSNYTCTPFSFVIFYVPSVIQFVSQKDRVV